MGQTCGSVAPRGSVLGGDGAVGEVRVRRVGPEGLDELMAWRMETLRDVFSIPAGEDVSALAAANRAYLAEELASGGHVAGLAELDGQAVGCGDACLTREMPSPDNPSGRCAYLMNVYVRPAFRHRGVGRALVAWLVGQARAWGADKVWLETSDAGRALYEAAGFCDLPGIMILPRSAE